MKAFSIRRLATALGIAAAVVGIATGSASASVVDTDTLKIWQGKADFGNGWHVGGAPTGDARLTWDKGSSTITVTLSGTVYWDDILSGGCARVRYRLYTTSGSIASTVYSTPVCRAGSGNPFSQPPQRTYTKSLSHPQAFKAHIVAQKAPGSGGPWTNDGGETRFYGVD